MTYSSAQMRNDLLRYIEANREELELLVEGNLYDRDMTFDEYVNMMKKNKTCGYEITLRIIVESFRFRQFFRKKVTPCWLDLTFSIN